MFEKRWQAIPPQIFTSNGTIDGKLTIADSREFKVKQKVIIANATTSQILEVKQVDKPSTIFVGPCTGSIKARTDISIYTIASGANISASEQERSKVPEEQIPRHVYEEEPTVAIRSFLVDEWGDDYTTNNPLPVQLSDGSINIGTVNAELEVQLSHKNNVPHLGDVADSVRIGNGVNELKVNADGSIDVNAVITGIQVPSTPIIANVSMPLANVQYSFTFPIGTKRFNLYVRGNAKLQYCFVTGQTNTNYKTLEMGASYQEADIINSAPLPLYFQASTPGRVLEILYWT